MVPGRAPEAGQTQSSAWPSSRGESAIEHDVLKQQIEGAPVAEKRSWRRGAQLAQRRRGRRQRRERRGAQRAQAAQRAQKARRAQRVQAAQRRRDVPAVKEPDLALTVT
jgi:hypothetical protein